MAAGTVNGQVYSFVHIKVALPSGMPQYLESIEYSDEEGGEIITNTAATPKASTRARASSKWA